MQPHQYALGAGILWLATLIVLPFLIAKARNRSFAQGFEAGKHHQKADFTLQVQSLRDDLAEAAVQAEADQRKHHISVANLKGTISELEARIMSYTDMPVTRADHELLTRTANTLKLAGRTWKAMHVDPQTQNAADQQRYIEELAARVHAQLRITPAKTPSKGKAA